MSQTDHGGFLNIDKPLHLTSHEVVARVRRRWRALTGSKKVGHAGTLDPLATGVLVICLGKATRLSDIIMRRSKVYRAEITVGASTTTYDAGGDFLSPPVNVNDLEIDAVRDALTRFIGEIQQVPPMYSAIKQGGRKLYDIARRGETVERPPRSVRIDSISIFGWNCPALELEVACGPGVYIRSLAHDLGETLGVGAYLSGLRRISSGAFRVEDGVTLESVLENDDWLARIVPPWDALADETKIIICEADIVDLRNGRAIPKRDAGEQGRVFAFDSGRRLVAELNARGEHWQPRKVFWTAS